MPIEGVSEIVRIPRLGKIHLGIKVQSKSNKEVLYPKATDYFVCPEEVIAVYGREPKELDVLFPVEDPELFAPQFYRAYSLSQGLVCIGTGIDCNRKVDIDTGAIADHSTKTWEWKESVCNPQDCPEYEQKRCRRVMNLQFMLPNVPGLGVYQIDTSSFHSIVNINSTIKMLKAILGRCQGIPLTLALGPVTVSPPGIKQKTVYIMHLKKNIKIAELARVAMLPVSQVLAIEAPDVEEPPDDLFPGRLIDDAKEKSKKNRAEKPVESPKDEELFGDDLPWADDPLLKAWGIVAPTVKRLNLTDTQVKKWFGHYNIEISRAEFDGPTPPAKITDDMLSKFQDMLDDYEEKHKS